MNSDDRHCRQIQADPHGETWDRDVRAHAESCPSCRAYLGSVAAIGRRLRDLPSFAGPMPHEIRKRMLAQIAESSTATTSAPASRLRTLLSPLQTRRVGFPAALAAMLVLGFFLGTSFDFKRPLDASEIHGTIGMYIEDVTHDHYLIERIGRPLEVAMNDGAELSQWLTASLGFPFQLPRTGSAFSLRGGRVWHTVGRLSAMAAYATEDGERVILFGVPARNLELRGAASSVVGNTKVFVGTAWGREARVWIDGDLAMAIVALEGQLPASWSEDFLP